MEAAIATVELSIAAFQGPKVGFNHKPHVRKRLQQRSPSSNVYFKYVYYYIKRKERPYACDDRLDI
jgi:hypothetical protein